MPREFNGRLMAVFRKKTLFDTVVARVGDRAALIKADAAALAAGLTLARY